MNGILALLIILFTNPSVFLPAGTTISVSVVSMPDELDRTIDELAMCESSNRPLIVNPYDRHGDSVGLLQFRRETFREQFMKYGLMDTSDWEPADWENALFDSTLQRKLAKLMIADGQLHRWGSAPKLFTDKCK